MRGDTMRSRILVWVLFLALVPPAVVHAQEKSESPPAPAVGVGDMAPDFTLRDQNGNQVTLSDFRGEKRVILAFYVFAFTGG
jgi:cytochrome oxidase Cu insertion factor (SCO1/SenC/PrrC family)